MAYDTAHSSSPAGGVPFGSRAEVFPTSPLPDLNSVGGPAFAAQFKGDASSSLMAILCNTGLPARIAEATAMRTIDHPGLLRLADNGVVLWPTDDTRYFAFAYYRPLAPRFLTTLEGTYPAMSEDNINHYFVTPMIGALNELARTGTAHNGIRPTNIFWRVGSATPPQLGECLSAPAGYGQPVLFETLERAMSSPMGRGVGTHVDDCYAFGVTLALLVLGSNPMQGLDDHAIVQMKLERGSFGALIGNHRLSGTHIELLRGLLTDDARQRWTGADLELWLSGRRLTPKNTDAGRRASRHFEFAHKEYYQVRPLAIALASHVSDAVHAIESGSIDKWLRRAMGDEERATDVSDAVASLKESGKAANYEEQVVTRACMALDPAAPIRYRGLAVMPAGIAGMMVEAVLKGQNAQILSEIISSQLVTLWVEMQKESKTELVPIGQQFERMKTLIEKTTFGNGFERVIYELNPGLPCLSPFLRSQYVTNPKAMLPALERVAASANRPREPMDRHIAAFLIVHDRRSELLFDAIIAPETSPKKGLGLLTLFSEMQQRHGPDSLPNLAQWLVPFLEVSVKRYLSKTLRENAQKQLKEVASHGNLSALQRLVDDPKRLERDQQEFMAARMLYFNILKEITSIEGKLANRDAVIQSAGKPMAASLSSFVAILLILVIILRAIWQNMF